MPKFQGSGFSIALPEESADVSAYSFVLPMPKGGKFAPFITIQIERLTKDVQLEAHVHEHHQALQTELENFRILSFAAGRNSGVDVVLTNVAWGPEDMPLSQVQAFYLVPGKKKNKVYGLKGTDLTENFANSQPVFNHAFQSFMPNDVQVLAEPQPEPR
jgi:hypothetical protein